MKHNQIALVAAAAAAHAAGYDSTRNRQDLVDLYGYARERKFPPAETLARKLGERLGQPFAFTSIDLAPPDLKIFFTAFRAVAEALEPFHEAGTEGEALEPPPPNRDPIADLVAAAGCDDAQVLVDMAIVGNSLMAAIGVYTAEGEILADWTPAEDPAEIVGDLAEVLRLARDEVQALDAQIKDLETKLADKEAKLAEKEKTDEQSVEERTRRAQEETDQAIAESGGKFSDGEQKTKKKK